jgi:adenylate kinase
MDRGELVSDAVVIGIVRERLNRDDVVRGFVLDGFPRTVPQAKALDVMMDGRDPLIVVDIVVPEAELVRRLLMRMVCEECGLTAGGEGERCRDCGGRLVQRSDDNKAVVLERLKVYLRQTKPLVEYYQARPTFRSVDGSQPPDSVAADLVTAIEAAANGLAAKVVRS